MICATFSKATVRDPTRFASLSTRSRNTLLVVDVNSTVLIFDFLNFRNIFQIPSRRLLGMKRDADNDNDVLTFQTLGLAAALVVNRLRISQQLRELELAEQ